MPPPVLPPANGSAPSPPAPPREPPVVYQPPLNRPANALLPDPSPTNPLPKRPPASAIPPGWPAPPHENVGVDGVLKFWQSDGGPNFAFGWIVGPEVTAKFDCDCCYVNPRLFLRQFPGGHPQAGQRVTITGKLLATVVVYTWFGENGQVSCCHVWRAKLLQSRFRCAVLYLRYVFRSRFNKSGSLWGEFGSIVSVVRLLLVRPPCLPECEHGRTSFTTSWALGFASGRFGQPKLIQQAHLVLFQKALSGLVGSTMLQIVA